MNGLFGSPVLEVGIGLVFVFTLLSLLCTTLNEWLMSYILKLRPKLLDRALDSLLAEQGMPEGNLRDYLSAVTFAKTMLDLVTPRVQGVINFADVQAGVSEMPDGEIKKTLIALMADTENDLNKLRRNIEDWFDEAMERTTGAFKRHAQLWAVLVAAILTILTNADTLAISQKLWDNPSLRAEAIKLAEQRAEMPRPTVKVEYNDADDPLNPTIAKEPQDSLTADEQNILGKLIGWEKPLTEHSVGDVLRHFPGWFLTIVAVSLGAPFWFDVLNKIMKLRNAGRVPPKGKDQEAQNA